MPAKYFNIAGPCRPDRHYLLPAVERLPAARRLAEEGQYFVLHAPRQSGKTTLLQALAREINAAGHKYALYCTLENLQGLTEPDQSMTAALSSLRFSLETSELSVLRERKLEPGDPDPTLRLARTLRELCRGLDKPLVLFFDEVDCLSGQVLNTFLRQLRAGYVVSQEGSFPWSIALIGLRDIRDFQIQVRSKTLGSASPFNIVAEALTLADFSPAEVAILYGQHTEATGRIFAPEALARAWHWSEGQPWLVNALARQALGRGDLQDADGSIVTGAMIDAAAEALMKRRDTHMDSLLERLKEPRVRRVIEPLLTGASNEVSLLHDDTAFCLDLGLVKFDEATGTLRPANPIYSDVIVRTLTYDAQMRLSAGLEGRWLDGQRLNLSGLLMEFQRFWRENSEIWRERYDYKEAAPHLILQAFLQRAVNVNGGARIDREWAAGLGRVDICLAYAGQKYPVELKLSDNFVADEAKAQLARYMERCGSREGWLIVFDRHMRKPWSEKIYWRDETLPSGEMTHIVGC